MGSLISKAIQFAKSPTGKKLIKEAEHAAKDPKTRAEAENIAKKL